MNGCTEITFLDFAPLFMFIILGAWKGKELTDVYAPKLAHKIIKWIEK